MAGIRSRSEGSRGERFGSRGNFGPLLVLTVLITIACGLTAYAVVLRLGARPASAAAGAASAGGEQFNPLLECSHLMPLPFGQKASNECTLNCFAPDIDRKLCEKVCSTLMADEYAGRLRPADENPAALAKGIISRCAADRTESKKPAAMPEWAEAAAKAYEFLERADPDLLLYERTVLLDRFLAAEEHDRLLKVPEDGSVEKTELALRMQTVFCARQATAAVQLAVLESAEAADSYSERFYRRLEASLLDQTAPLEAEVKKRRNEMTPAALQGQESPAAAGGNGLKHSTAAQGEQQL